MTIPPTVIYLLSLHDALPIFVSFQQPLSGAAAGRWAPYVAWSGDGGERWTVAQGIAPPNYALAADPTVTIDRSEEHTSELQSHSDLVCRLLREKKKKTAAQEK